MPSSTPSLTPTRQTEADRVAAHVAAGSSLLIVAHPGEDRTAVALVAVQGLSKTTPTPFRCSRRTTPEQLQAWFDEHLPLGYGILNDVDTLSPELAGPLANMMEDRRLRVLATADTVAMRAPLCPSLADVASVLNDLARRRRIQRIDLMRVSDVELAEIIRRGAHPQRFDGLQEAVLVQASRGSLAVARDLTRDALGAPHLILRRTPNPWSANLPLSAATRDRIASRYRDVPEELRLRALLLHQLGPLFVPTATRLYGAETLTRLDAAGLTEVAGPAGSPRIFLSSVDAASLTLFGLPEDLAAKHAETLQTLRRLHHEDADLPAVTSLTLARHLVGADTELTPDDARIFSGAARISAQRGHAAEAESLAGIGLRLGDEARSVPVLWKAGCMRDRHAAILREAKELVAEQPEKFTPNHLHRAAIAASWQTEPPAWLMEALSRELGTVSPAHARLYTRLVGGEASVAELAAELATASQDPDEAVAVRLWAHSALIVAAVEIGEISRLESALTAASPVRQRLTDNLGSLEPWEREACHIFDITFLTAGMLAGVDTESVRSRLHELTLGAAGSDGGCLASACVLYLHMLDDFLRGDADGEAVNLSACVSFLDRSTFAINNLALAEFAASVAPEDLEPGKGPQLFNDNTAFRGPQRTSHLTTMRLFTPKLADQGHPLPAPGDPPAWAQVFRAHRRVLSGQSNPAQELRRLPAADPSEHFPSSMACIRHLEALEHKSPELLLRAGELLETTGQFDAARRAYQDARHRFLARRQTSRATECAEHLERMGEVVQAAPEPEQPSDYPAGLTRREYEICVLVGANLTNAQIAERLVVSVRTVESHVLQARAKLGAPRRRDIPERLARLGTPPA